MLGGADTQDDNARQGLQHDTGRSAGCANRPQLRGLILFLLCPVLTIWYPHPPPPCPPATPPFPALSFFRLLYLLCDIKVLLYKSIDSLHLLALYSSYIV